MCICVCVCVCMHVCICDVSLWVCGGQKRTLYSLFFSFTFVWIPGLYSNFLAVWPVP